MNGYQIFYLKGVKELRTNQPIKLKSTWRML